MKSTLILLATLTLIACGDTPAKQAPQELGPQQSTCRNIQVDRLQDEIRQACQTVSDEERTDAAKAIRYRFAVEVGGDETKFNSTTDGWVLYVEDGWTQQTLDDWMRGEVDFWL